MRLTHLADYAVVMMTAAARRGAARGCPRPSLPSETGVPLPTAQKLMGQLAGAGLLTSARGAGGGFTLARPGTEISLADIVEAVEGPIAMTMCCGTTVRPTARSTPIAGSSRTWASSATRCAARSARCTPRRSWRNERGRPQPRGS